MPHSKKVPVTQTGLSEGFRKDYSTLHSQYTGYHSGVVKHQPPRKYSLEERKTQFINHMATTLKGYYNYQKGKSEIEIQIAIVGDGLFVISSNKDQTAKDFYAELVEASVNNVKQKMIDYAKKTNALTKGKTSNERFRIKRHTGKMQKELLGGRHVNDVTNLGGWISALEITGLSACVMFDAVKSSETDVINFCTGAMAGKKIAIVTAEGKKWHAEQKILYMLVRAKTLGALDVTFGGTFRPCRGCFESLVVVKHCYIPRLTFGQNPGHYWETTDQAHIAVMKMLIKQGKLNVNQLQGSVFEGVFMKGKTRDTFRPQLRTPDGNEDDLHYASESDSDDE